jgi:fructose-1,6-bisphosphatase/inositol monophosphatase family enzyme
VACRGGTVTYSCGARVAELVRSVARTVQLLRSRGAVRVICEGAEGPTTNADLTAQRLLVDGLRRIDPAAAVVAEEGTRYRSGLNPGARAWIIDPVDGTSSFVAGDARYGVQVAAYSGGRITGGWISCPDLGWHLAAWDGGPLTVEGVPASAGGVRVVIASGDFDAGHLARLRSGAVPPHRPTRSCAVDYAELTAGGLDALVYRRTHPWDHAPGAYLASRAGAAVNSWDGSPFDPGTPGQGILALSRAALSRSADAAAMRAMLLPPAA